MLGAAALSWLSSVVVIITVDSVPISYFRGIRSIGPVSVQVTDMSMLDHHDQGQMSWSPGQMSLDGTIREYGLQLNSGMLPISRPLCGWRKWHWKLSHVVPWLQSHGPFGTCAKTAALTGLSHVRHQPCHVSNNSVNIERTIVKLHTVTDSFTESVAYANCGSGPFFFSFFLSFITDLRPGPPTED